MSIPLKVNTLFLVFIILISPVFENKIVNLGFSKMRPLHYFHFFPFHLITPEDFKTLFVTKILDFTQLI